MISVQKIVNTRPQSFKSKMSAEERTNKKVKVVPSVAKVIIKKESEPLVHLPKEKDLDPTLEFCRLVNTGVYHPMYRYGIGLVTKNLIHPILLVYHLHFMSDHLQENPKSLLSRQGYSSQMLRKGL